MNSIKQRLCLHRRDFFTSAASGIGAAALLSLLQEDSAHAAPGGPHFAAKAKRCICIFLPGGASHLDLFQYKPVLNQLHGQRPSDELLKGKRFAFLKKESAMIMGTKRTFSQHGQSGMWFSDVLPNLTKHADKICKIDSMFTTQFNHHPAQLVAQTGHSVGGHPTLGAWLGYGLGSENMNLPSYVVLNSATNLSSGTDAWQSGFLPANYQGVPFQPSGSPVLNLLPPSGFGPVERDGLDALKQLNTLNHLEVRDPAIETRIENFELAYRMQMEAPGVVDLSQESAAVQDRYGIAGGAPFARHCLLARRMIESGVRFVNLLLSDWDTHSDLDSRVETLAGVLDKALTALIDDLHDRGLLDETLVFVISDFGRTPLGENRPGFAAVTGRDHHPDAYTVLMVGGGAKPGLTYGTTDELGWSAQDNPVHISDLHATMLHLFGFDHLRLGYDHLGVMQRLTPLTRESKVITELLA